MPNWLQSWRCICGWSFLAAGLLSACAPAAWGDTFELANGGKLTGKLLNPDESPRTTFEIQLDEGAVLSLAAGQVLRVAEKSEAELWYEEARKSMVSDVAGHLAMAKQCRGKRLEAQRLYHLEQVLAVEPENATARRELGFAKMDGTWVLEDAWHRSRGYVKYKGKWVVPQEVEIDQAEEELAERTVQWTGRIKTWREWVLKQRDRADEGMNNILSIDDPAAAEPLARWLGEKKEPLALKRAYIKVLGRLPGATASVALVARALNDSDAGIRDLALEQLAARKDRTALQFFIRILERASDSNTPAEENIIVNLAAIGLARLNDDAATLPLIEALRTKHKFVKSGGAGMNPIFNKSGGGGINMGGRPQVEIREISNQNVRDALINLHPGMNFGFDETAWKRWYEQSRTPIRVDLRRDIE